MTTYSCAFSDCKPQSCVLSGGCVQIRFETYEEPDEKARRRTRAGAKDARTAATDRAGSQWPMSRSEGATR